MKNYDPLSAPMFAVSKETTMDPEALRAARSKLDDMAKTLARQPHALDLALARTYLTPHALSAITQAATPEVILLPGFTIAALQVLRNGCHQQAFEALYAVANHLALNAPGRLEAIERGEWYAADSPIAQDDRDKQLERLAAMPHSLESALALFRRENQLPARDPTGLPSADRLK